MKSKNNQIKVKINKDASIKHAKKANQLHMKEKNIGRHNGNDPKLLEPGNILWAYKSLFFYIAKSHSLITCL